MKIKQWVGDLKNTILEHRDRWPIVIALATGFILIHQGIGSYKKSLGLGQPFTEILISSKLISEGQTIVDSDVETQKIPSKYIPMGTLKPSDLSKISGHTLTRSISKGEIILWRDLNLNYNYTSASAKIEHGYRAVSIGVDQVSSVSNLIQPGDHVDIITTFEIPGESKPSTLTLLQNITVLTVGDYSKDDQVQSSYSSITLMVLPEEANIITHSSKYGNLSLVLRNPMDMKTNKDLGIISNQDIVQAAFRNKLQSERDLIFDTEK